MHEVQETAEVGVELKERLQELEKQKQAAVKGDDFNLAAKLQKDIVEVRNILEETKV